MDQFACTQVTWPHHQACDRRGRRSGAPGARLRQWALAVSAFESEQLDYDYRDIEQQKKILADRFADQGWEVPKLLAHLDAAEDFYFDAMAQIRMDDWSKGRVALVGDAGYCASPLSGQGADLSLVGAYILAGELAAAGGDHTIAFTRYRAEMLPMVQACQTFAEGVANGMHRRAIR
ncbi:FAD-dependent monooxygenase [Nocardia sp. NPDC052112]|uniref:FAD-dependent monooxygenase n=1 Tax=Nocardia sp. NPDC052112 TaxID=3155646 RepID=UPI003420AD4D